MYPEDAGDFGAGAACGEHREDLGSLLRHELGSPPARSAMVAGGFQPGAGTLAHHGALEFGEGSEHLHHHASGRSGGVDRLRQGAEVRARRIDFLQDVEEILERARQAVEFPHDDGIALAQLVEKPVQLGPIPTAAGGFLLVNSGTADRLEGADLGRGILIVGLRDMR